MTFQEADFVNQVAAQERSIVGIKNSYNYAANPDMLPNTALPAVIHFIPEFNSEIRGNFNLWKNTMTLQSILFVMPREAQGGKLRFIENEVIPYGQKWRAKFQDNTVIGGLLTQVAGVKVFLTKGQYGAGGLLDFAGASYLGWIFSFTAVSA